MTTPQLYADVALLSGALKRALTNNDAIVLDLEGVAALARVLTALNTRTEALKWYADPKNNGKQEYVEIKDAASVHSSKWRPIDDDQGEVARDALREEVRGG